MTRPTNSRPESSVERFFLSQPLQLATVGQTVELDGSEAHHLLHVLRAKVGNRVGLFNGDGDEALADVKRIGKRSADLFVTEAWTTPTEARRLTLATALPKGDRARWLVEKATELGVTRLIPLRTARSIVEPGAGKLDKLEQAVIAACKQSGRSRLLHIDPLTSFDEVLRRTSSDADTSRFIAHPQASRTVSSVLLASKTQPTNTLAFIGPEGGFTNEEFAAAETAGVTSVMLGRSILRIETAALAFAAAWNFANAE